MLYLKIVQIIKYVYIIFFIFFIIKFTMFYYKAGITFIKYEHNKIIKYDALKRKLLLLIYVHLEFLNLNNSL